MQSPGDAASRFYLQLIEPDAQAPLDDEAPERYQRIGFGTRRRAGRGARSGAAAASRSSTAATAVSARRRDHAHAARQRQLRTGARPAAMNIEQLRHGHHLAGRPAGGQAARDRATPASRRSCSARATSSATRRARQPRCSAVKASGLRGTGFQVLRDFEGLSGQLHDYKVDIAKSMLEMCAALGCKVLLACSSTSRMPARTRTHSRATCASWRCWRCRIGVKVAYEALSWGRTVNEFTHGLGRRRTGRLPQPGHRAGLVPHVRGAGRPRRPGAARPAAHLPGAAVRLHVAGDTAPSKSA